MSLLLIACSTVVLISTPCGPGVKPIPGVFVRSVLHGPSAPVPPRHQSVV